MLQCFCSKKNQVPACRLLQVEASASAAEIKQAFRRLALKLHPDVNQEADAAERFSEVSNAYGKPQRKKLAYNLQ